ncbi:CLUMA_CG016883, isoform A [Clunio marinus]|uniref:CLUMA_CG016883, isoform A n=1 Tax=Clunio marinus TaxID=568069 RepID=A0A1J1IVK6_9DIPT|nr:CLUMA_CG016883, isoform A [Clunio marinus]
MWWCAHEQVASKENLFHDLFQGRNQLKSEGTNFSCLAAYLRGIIKLYSSGSTYLRDLWNKKVKINLKKKFEIFVTLRVWAEI